MTNPTNTPKVSSKDRNLSTDDNQNLDTLIDHLIKQRQSIRIKAGIDKKKQKGEKYSRIPPYGYDYVNDKLVENSREKQLLKSVIYWKQEQGRTFRHIVEALNFNGYLTKTGKKWTIRTLSHIYYKAISNRLPL